MNLQPGTLLTYSSTTYTGAIVDNPWNGKKALVLDLLMSDVISPDSVINVLIDGHVDYVGALCFVELVEHYGWRFGE